MDHDQNNHINHNKTHTHTHTHIYAIYLNVSNFVFLHIFKFIKAPTENHTPFHIILNDNNRIL